LLGEFGRLVRELKPGLVTMENVPRLASKKIFRDFVRGLVKAGYQVSYRSVYCPTFGIAQHRRRLVLVASLIGSVAVPKGPIRKRSFKTVRDAIGKLPPVAAGRADPRDRLHKARSMSDMLLRRVRASQPGGTWRDWPEELRAPCHRKESGKSYQAVYSRMEWDAPSPTITTLFHSFGSGRFGHPEQDRALTLREAAILQSFPRRYRFLKRSEPVQIRPIALLIGNAVPPRLGRYVGRELVRAARAHGNPTR
jgi:DNA (cytosine-5)-methyltransferase 1